MSGRDFSTSRHRTGSARGDTALLVAGALAAILAAHGAGRARSTLGAARGAVLELRREVEGERSRIQALEASEGTGERYAAQALLTVEAEPPRVVAAIAALLPPDVRLEALHLSYGNRLEMDLQVAARRASAYDRFLAGLAESSRIREVLPGAENREGEVRAAVHALYQPPVFK